MDGDIVERNQQPALNRSEEEKMWFGIMIKQRIKCQNIRLHGLNPCLILA